MKMVLGGIMIKLILGVIIGYCAVMIFGPDIAYDIWYNAIELIREAIKQ